MPAGRLTDIPGLRVGHWTDTSVPTGCTVIVPPIEMVGAIDVGGGGASTRETALFTPGFGPRNVSALLLSGGSAFGLAAADGVMRWCEENGRGIDTGAALVPIVPAAVIYDLGIGGSLRPGPEEGYAACIAATEDPHAVGSVGAGTGATVGKWHAQDGWCKGGIGAASDRTPAGYTVAALAVVNAFGDILDEMGDVLAGVWVPGEGFPGAAALARGEEAVHPRLVEGRNTTLVAVATDAPIGAVGAGQVARMCRAGLGRAISPVNTPIDGDVTFSLAMPGTANAFVVGMLAGEVVAEAIREGVRAATSLGGVPTADERRDASA